MLKEINPKFNRSVKARKIGEKGLGTLFLIFVMVLLVGLGFVVIYPVFTTLSLAFRPAREMFDETVIWIPKEPTLNNFVRAAEDLDYFHLVFKTVAVSLVCTLFSIISCSMAAYSLSRFNYKYKNILFLLVVFTIVVPPQTAQIPMFVSFRNFNFFGVGKLVGLITGKDMTVNLINTQWSLILPSVFAAGLQAGLFIFIFRQFFLGMPKGLEEAAKVDGCNAVKTFIRIIVPNSIPVFVVVFLLSMVQYWNDTTVTGVYLFSDKSYLLMHKLSNIVSTTMTTSYEYGEAEVLFGAMAVIVIIPPIILYTLCQTQFSEFLDRSGIKG